jgi:large subunit ribosomal protein L43
MATRGVFQLTKLYINYCEHGGSSRMLRSYIGNGTLSKWAMEHPHVEIHVQCRNGKHPFIQADYLTNSNHTSCHQISVKNYNSIRDINDVMDLLSNRSGRKITKITKPVLTDTPSIQGIWTPFLNLQMKQEPEFQIQFIHRDGTTSTTNDEKSINPEN